MANNFIDKSLNTISEFGNSVTSKYDEHIKNKAIKQVDEMIVAQGLNIDDISKDDYEAMVNEAMIEIKEEYASNTTKVALAALGLDLFLG